jgi:hypothetical protein
MGYIRGVPTTRRVAKSLEMKTETTRAISDRVAFYRAGRVERKALRKSHCNNGFQNHYPRGEGLATSPCRRARLRFHSPFCV